LPQLRVNQAGTIMESICCADGAEGRFRPLHHRRLPPAIKVNGKILP
jgi:hypothetical protein